MPDTLLIWTLAGFAVVVGSMALVHLRRGRAATAIDDPSILLAAPPEGMTPASAAIVDGAPTRVAFMAALLDLASRGEIGFAAESVTGDRADIGIEIGGAGPMDPRVQQNRRQPAGEAEAWLLGQLELAAGHRRHAPWDADAQSNTNFPFLIETGESMVGAVLREASLTPADQAGAAATEEREHGLLSAGGADPATIARAYEAQTGHALPAPASRALAAATRPQTPEAAPVQASEALAASAPASGPDAATDSDPDAATDSDPDAGTDAPSAPPLLHISARDARALATPMFFGTFLETYARRHGWLGAMPIVTRIRWRIAGAVAVVTGIALLSTGVHGYSDSQTGLGLGLLFGGLVAYWLAPKMVQPSAEGGRVRAQLAAYRRTLQMTFRSASSVRDAVGPAGLPWLSTPDQAIAWAVALGLAPDVEALLTRSASSFARGEAAAPVWYRPFHGRRGAAPDGGSAVADPSPATMFAGIEAIGSWGAVGPRWLRPMRSWWPA